jgi:hypothetical protein
VAKDQEERIKMKSKKYLLIPFITMAIILGFALACGGSGGETASVPEGLVEEVEEVTVGEEPEPEVMVEEEPEPEEIVEEEPSIEEKPDEATLGEKNAALKALDYLAYMPFSYSGLVEQLKFEGYTHEEAVYGVDKCGADWNEQAALKAEDYLNYSSFSRTELIAQLEFEGFTRQQAEYGVQAVGY